MERTTPLGLVTILFLCLTCINEDEKFKLKKIPSSGPPANSQVFPGDTVCRGYWLCITEGNLNTGILGSYYVPGAFGAATSAYNKAFFAGGHEEGYIGSTLSSVLIIYGTGGWDVAWLSLPRSHLAATSAGGKVFFAGGNNSYSTNPVYGYGASGFQYYSTVDIFDAINHGRSYGTLSEERSDLAAVGAGNKAYFIGGKTMNGYSSKMDVYDVEHNEWHVVDMPRERGFAGAAVADDKIYILGGKNMDGNLTVVDVYDHTTGVWSEMEMPHEHPIAAVVAVNHKIVVAGGDGKQNKAVDIYDTSTSTWYSTELSDSRYNIAIAAANNKVIFFSGNFSPNVDVYDIEQDTWTLAKLSSGVTGASATSGGDRCLFSGLLYSNGNAWVESVMFIWP
jgi:hypothetical protein